MAKREWNLDADFDHLLAALDRGILEGSVSASFEDGSDYSRGPVRCAVRVYERYSMMGGNRVSLNITLFDDGNQRFLSAITSGGSQGAFFKVNTLGEKNFLSCVEDIVRQHGAGGR